MLSGASVAVDNVKSFPERHGELFQPGRCADLSDPSGVSGDMTRVTQMSFCSRMRRSDRNLRQRLRVRNGMSCFTFQQESEELLDATLDMDSDTVAEKIEKIHMEYASAIQYNNENSLSSVLAIAYLSAMQYYFKPVREMPAGRGFADFVFLPKPEYAKNYPALVVELKWNQNGRNSHATDKRIKNIRSRWHIFLGDILLVAINYDKKTKEHQCRMEVYKK